VYVKFPDCARAGPWLIVTQLGSPPLLCCVELDYPDTRPRGTNPIGDFENVCFCVNISVHIQLQWHTFWSHYDTAWLAISVLCSCNSVQRINCQGVKDLLIEPVSQSVSRSIRECLKSRFRCLRCDRYLKSDPRASTSQCKPLPRSGPSSVDVLPALME
jgi:hypothetical protein